MEIIIYLKSDPNDPNFCIVFIVIIDNAERKAKKKRITERKLQIIL
jgi:hypothetical protein